MKHSIRNGKDLLLLRKKEHRNEQFDLWKLAVDWTVWLYFLVPLAGILIFQYIKLWQGAAAWAEYISPIHVGLLFFLFILNGYWITYMKQADLLILWQKNDWIHSLRKASLVELLKKQLHAYAVTYMVVLPLLTVYFGWSLIYSILFLIFIYLANCLIILHRKQIEIRFHKWWMRLMEIPVVLLVGLFIVYNTYVESLLILAGTIFIAFLFIIYLVRVSLKKPVQFEREISLEGRRLNQMGNFILSQSTMIGGVDISRKRFSSLSRPLLFRKSNRLSKKRNPKNGLVEVYLKTALRDLKNISVYLRLLGIGGFVITLISSNYSWVFFVITIFLLILSVRDYWYQLVNHRYFHLADWKKFNTESSVKKGTFILLLPGCTLLSMYQGFLMYSWLGLVILPVLVMGIIWLFLDLFLAQVVLNENFHRLNHLNDQ